MTKNNLILFISVFFIVLSIFSFSPLKASVINDDPNDGIWNDGPWEDPSNKPDFFLGNTEEFSIQNLFINGKPLNPSVYFFSIHKEVFIPVRIATYALGGKVFWDPVNRKVFVNGKELNTTRVILGYTCYVPLRSIAKVFKAQVAYDTKNHSAALWSQDPGELGYPVERWYIGTPEYYARLHKKAAEEKAQAELQAARDALKQQGVTDADKLDSDYFKQQSGTPSPQLTPPPVQQPELPLPENNTGQPVIQQPAGGTPVPSAAPTQNGNPFNFGF